MYEGITETYYLVKTVMTDMKKMPNKSQQYLAFGHRTALPGRRCANR